jgi:hypothetical protein
MVEERAISPGTIEVDLFSQEVDSPDHPDAADFRRLLEDVALDYDCTLVRFEVHAGTVCFAFDDDVLTAEIIRELEIDYGV